MAPEAKLIFRTIAGVKFAELVGSAYSGSGRHGGFYTLHCRREVNAIEQLTWTMALDNALLDELEVNSQVELWQRDLAQGINWYKEFDGIYRTVEAQTTDHDVFTGRAYDAKMLLMWRHVLYKTNVTDRSIFNDASESIMKRLVRYNCTIDGDTADGRLKDAVYSDGNLNGFEVTIETDDAEGTVVHWACAQDNILETLQKLSRVGNGDFDMIKTSGNIYEFRFYHYQRGTDRRYDVTFSTTYDNMVNPKYVYDQLSEKTSVTIGGQGQEDARTFTTVTGLSYTAQYNDIETFIAATNLSTVATLNDFGAQKADLLRARPQLTFGIRQSSKIYGRDYFLGDIVTSVYDPLALSIIQKVQAVTIAYAKTGERTLTPELRNEAPVVD